MASQYNGWVHLQHFDFQVDFNCKFSGKFVAACIGFFLMAVLYEGLKYYREVLFIESEKTKQRVVKTSNGETIVTTAKLSAKQQLLNVPHFVQTALHLLQVTVSYILMLIIMLCNNWLIIAICLGAAVGYFAFGWLRKLTFKDSTECCY